MPHKQNSNSRNLIPKMRIEVMNWAEYEAGLRRRGSATLWITDETITAWAASGRTTPGGQATCSDCAIQTGLMLQAAFKLALRLRMQSFSRDPLLVDAGHLRTTAVAPLTFSAA